MSTEFGKSPRIGAHRAPYKILPRQALSNRTRKLLIVGLGLIVTGCSEELGPVPLKLTRVRGVLREGSRPVPGGWIEFCPVEGTVGNLRSARVRTDGSFEADGVALGEHLIRLVNAPTAVSGMNQLFGSFQSLIRRVIADRPDTPMVVDLVEEAIRFHRTKARGVRPESSGSGEAP